ncbi:hypothetical protein [Tamaricihabitans halophyticus]|nr:hypothetical protein [Tamaricihabitans halophyticus]
MSRPEPVRFLRTVATMAFPEGRLLALRDARLHVLAPDGWTALGRERPPGSVWLSRAEAEQWCDTAGCDARFLDNVPGD